MTNKRHTSIQFSDKQNIDCKTMQIYFRLKTDKSHAVGINFIGRILN